MDNLKTDKFLTNLIDTNSDAQTNLFTMELSYNTEVFNYRISKVKLPAVENKLVDLPYQNIGIQIPSTGTAVDRTVQLTMRLNSNYSALKDVMSKMSITENGLYSGRGSKEATGQKSFTAVIHIWQTVEDGLSEVAYYTFNNCMHLKVPPLELGYDNSQPIMLNLSFVYSTYDITYVDSQAVPVGALPPKEDK